MTGIEWPAVVREDLERIAAEAAGWDKLRDKTVLVTGAGGMIASYLCYTLLHLNEQRGLNVTVLAMVRGEEKARRHFARLEGRRDFVLVKGDVCRPPAVEGNVDYIVHAASQASPHHFLEDPVGTMAANVDGTKAMLELAVEKKAAGFLFLSTREIYGKPAEGMEFVGEDDFGALDSAAPRSCYPESKRMGEALCAAYRRQYGVNAKIARIAHTYGPGMTLGDGRVMGDFVADVAAGRNIRMNSDGRGELGVTYLSDLVAGLFMCLLDFPDMAYNISNETAVLSVRELAELLVSLRPEKGLRVECAADASAPPGGYLNYRIGLLRSDKARAAGWTPRVDAREGFERTLRAAEEGA